MDGGEQADRVSRYEQEIREAVKAAGAEAYAEEPPLSPEYLEYIEREDTEMEGAD